jgi:hypothetical protein
MPYHVKMADLVRTLASWRAYRLMVRGAAQHESNPVEYIRVLVAVLDGAPEAPSIVIVS